MIIYPIREPDSNFYNSTLLFLRYADDLDYYFQKQNIIILGLPGCYGLLFSGCPDAVDFLF